MGSAACHHGRRAVESVSNFLFRSFGIRRLVGGRRRSTSAPGFDSAHRCTIGIGFYKGACSMHLGIGMMGPLEEDYRSFEEVEEGLLILSLAGKPHYASPFRGVSLAPGSQPRSWSEGSPSLSLSFPFRLAPPLRQYLMWPDQGLSAPMPPFVPTARPRPTESIQALALCAAGAPGHL